MKQEQTNLEENEQQAVVRQEALVSEEKILEKKIHDMELKEQHGILFR